MTALTKPCTDPVRHPKHLCQLKKLRLTDEIEKHSVAPVFVCHNCNAMADCAEVLCNPGALPASI